VFLEPNPQGLAANCAARYCTTRRQNFSSRFRMIRPSLNSVSTIRAGMDRHSCWNRSERSIFRDGGLHVTLRRHAARFGAISHLPLVWLWIASVVSAEPVTLIRDNGDPANRVDIVILGDGYTASELAKFATDVEGFVNGLFAQEPWKEYQKYFNVHRVDVTSAESGADHPERTPPLFKDTAFNATYNCAGIQRLICVDVSKVNTVLVASVPPDTRDLVLLIVNDSEYGGSGGSIAVASVHPDVVELILLEVGHSFGLLADEYGGPPPPSCNAALEPPEANATMETQREGIKWAVWIEPDTPIPTLGPTVAEPGLYEGAKYCDTGLFRPTYNSKMRSLFQPYEQINSEQLVKQVYGLVSPLDSAEPSDSTITLRDGQSQTFKVKTLEPLTHALDIVWRIDGQTVAIGNELTLRAADLSPGSHRVEVTVSDPTHFVRNDAAHVLADTHGWDVSIVVDVIPQCNGPSPGVPWKNHGAFVSAVVQAAEALVAAGRITEGERDSLVRNAARSDCGKSKTNR
jgi:IgA Peptidase M64